MRYAIVAALLLAFAAVAQASEISEMAKKEKAEADIMGGLYTEEWFTVIKSVTFDLAPVESTCHGCYTCAKVHYVEIDQKVVNEAKETAESKYGIKAGTSSTQGASAGGNIEGVDVKVTESRSKSADGHGESSSSSGSSDSAQSTYRMTVGLKGHAPSCQTWNVRVVPIATVVQKYNRVVRRVTILFRLLYLCTDTPEGPMIMTFGFRDETTNKECCCASRGKGGHDTDPSASPSPSPTPGPDGPKPQPTPQPGQGQGKKPVASGASKGDSEMKKAQDFLKKFNPSSSSGAPADIQKIVLDSIERSALDAGINLDILGAWRRGFLSGFYAGDKQGYGLVLPRRGGSERVVIPETLEEGEIPQVKIDDAAAPPGSVSVKKANDGSNMTMVTVTTPRKPAGATITVTPRSGTQYRAETPADRVTIAATTTITRGPKTTTITVTPRVESTDPSGKATTQAPGGQQGVGKTGYRIEDKQGAFEMIFKQGITFAGSTVVAAGVGYLLTPKQGSSGSATMEIPNEKYDSVINEIGKKNPNFNGSNLADSIQPGIETPVQGGGMGIRVTSVFASGTSINSLSPGATLVFSVQVDAYIGSSFKTGAVSVDLADSSKASIGYMTVQEAAVDPNTGAGTVTATLPPNLSANGQSIFATVKCSSGASNEVAMKLEPSVELIAMEKIVVSKSLVKVLLRSSTGGAIKGVLRIGGPGKFADGTTEMNFDTFGTADALVLTLSPGEIALSFEPSEDGSTTKSIESKFD